MVPRLLIESVTCAEISERDTLTSLNGINLVISLRLGAKRRCENVSEVEAVAIPEEFDKVGVVVGTEMVCVATL